MNITPEMLDQARKRKEEAERLANSFSNNDPDNPANICIGCE